MAELKPCPFCGREAEMHVRWNSYEECVEKKQGIPDGAKFLYVKVTGKHKYYYYRRYVYIPRCTDTECVGRTTKPFWDEDVAEEAWNRRADNG